MLSNCFLILYYYLHFWMNFEGLTSKKGFKEWLPKIKCGNKQNNLYCLSKSIPNVKLHIHTILLSRGTYLL